MIRPSARTRPARVFVHSGAGVPPAWMQQHRKPGAKPRARTSPPPPPPVFEIPTQNRFAPLHEMACDAVIIGDSIVRQSVLLWLKVRCTLAVFLVLVFSMSLHRYPRSGKKNIGAVVLLSGTNDIRLRQTEILKKDFRSLVEKVHTTSPTRGSSCRGHFPRSSEESRGSVDYSLLMNGYSHGVKIRNYLLLITGIFSGSVLGSTVLMACTQAELEQQSSQTTSPGHYAPSDC
ncbi:hypothetical protein QTP86_016981 [Hemibagrus guttatus]|nr:hypothetical protein QTP86_016981 [Hemibagrus guttatus]